MTKEEKAEKIMQEFDNEEVAMYTCERCGIDIPEDQIERNSRPMCLCQRCKKVIEYDNCK